MRLPNVLQVGNHRYKVFAKRKVSLDGDPVYGFIDADKKVIEIEIQKSKLEIQETFLHEVLHSIGWEAGIKQLQTDKYNLVDRIARALLDVIRVNNLSQYLKGESWIRRKLRATFVSPVKVKGRR